MAAAVLLTGCASALPLEHSETACIVPGQTVTIRFTVPPGTQLSFQVQDDFGGEISPSVPPLTAGSSGQAGITWQSPGHLSTTTLHFLVTARKGDARASRDIHVAVGGNGRSC